MSVHHTGFYIGHFSFWKMDAHKCVCVFCNVLVLIMHLCPDYFGFIGQRGIEELSEAVTLTVCQCFSLCLYKHLVPHTRKRHCYWNPSMSSCKKRGLNHGSRNDTFQTVPGQSEWDTNDIIRERSCCLLWLCRLVSLKPLHADPADTLLLHMHQTCPGSGHHTSVQV